MKKIKVGIFGPAGRMGSDILLRIPNFKNLEISSLCERKGHLSVGKSLCGCMIHEDVKKIISSSDVIIDFTIPKATIQLLETLKNNKDVCLVTGTTGYSEKEEKLFKKLSHGLKVLRSFNMSIGINLLRNLVEVSSKRIGNFSDIEISEIHHNKKRDIPSGTAMILADSIKQGNTKVNKFSFREKGSNSQRKMHEIGFSSIRGGDVVGEHTVYFFMDGERIELTHKATDRKIFSNGALEAAGWLYNKKPGLYSIIDMLG